MMNNKKQRVLRRTFGATREKTKARSTYKILVRKSQGRYHLVDMGIDGRIIFKWILKLWGVRMRIRLYWLRIGSSDRVL
jgi:hypothetical protein